VSLGVDPDSITADYSASSSSSSSSNNKGNKRSKSSEQRASNGRSSSHRIGRYDEGAALLCLYCGHIGHRESQCPSNPIVGGEGGGSSSDEEDDGSEE
jgi:hypothetical protein